MLEQYYRILRKKPYTLVRNPHWLLFLPGFIYLFLKKRWKTDEEVVYLIETNLTDLHLTGKKIECDTKIVIVSTFKDAFDIIKQRIKDEEISDSYLDEVKKRFEIGDYLVLLSKNNMPASYLFISEKIANLRQVKYEIELEEDCFAIYDVYTFREFRGWGLYQTLIEYVATQMRNRHFKRFYLWVMKHNKISLLVHNKLGINHIIRVFSLRYRFGLRLFYKKDVNFYIKDLIDEKF